MTEAAGFGADAPADDTGRTSAEADVDAGYDDAEDSEDVDEVALGGTAVPGTSDDSHQADVDAGFDDSGADR